MPGKRQLLDIFEIETRNLLLLPILENCEVLALQISNEIPFLVARHHIHKHEFCRCTDRRRALLRSRLLGKHRERKLRIQCGKADDCQDSSEHHSIPSLQPEARDHRNAPHVGGGRHFAERQRIYGRVEAGELNDVKNIVGLNA